MTSSDFILARRMREYVADSNVDFKYSGNNVIKFTLNSADAFLDGRNSWLQFKLFAAVNVGTANLTAKEARSRLLETGGAHALFSRMRISLSNGTIISDYDYSQLYAMVRQHTMSAQHLEHQEGMSSYDGLYNSCSNGIKIPSKYFDGIAVPNTGTYTAATRTLGALGADATDNFCVGDEIFVESKAGSVYGKIETIADGVTMTVDATTCTPAQLADIAAGSVGSILRISGERSSRFRGAQGDTADTAVLCKVKLFSDFFNNIKYLPLPFLRNLTIELTLNRPAHSVVFAKTGPKGGPVAVTPDFEWTISSPVIVANLVTPSESLMNAYVDQYNSDQGIMLHWIDYQSNKVQSSNGVQNESLRIPSNCHSALSILVANKPAEAQSVVAGTSWFNDTNGNSVKTSIIDYQFQVGSEYFPFARPVNTLGRTNGNAWNYVLQALDSHGAKYECSSIVPQEYYASNDYIRVGGVVPNESLRFYMAARLDRDGNYTGIDTSNNDIQLNISRSGPKNAGFDGSYYHCFIIHNRLMRISKASSIVFS